MSGELKRLLTFKNKDEFNTFRILIQKSYKADNKVKRDKIRSEINPLVRKRDNYLCYFCGRNVLEINGSNTIHHKVPERYGGITDGFNLITICVDCHQKLENLITFVERNCIKAVCNFIKEKL